MKGWIAILLVLVSGVVTSRTGAPAVNVTVVVGNQSGLTDVRGFYRVDHVPPGQQVVRVVRENQTLVQKAVHLDPKAAAARVDVTLP